ncbi:hypothetical protein predicted by Glimmer/Critica [Bdellovibrio bacteriovorus HD100]|uniref:Uncharacterized protein n=1 Tax=Bdellovibrio bacteriovorus (strain ATCC 15356 / DSM 50701 / NCIMB 9529 / HD100) TaxID=264462 RepID=Q6MKW5_BDEBA|nr:hypothetical protein predicted by Glimmer/Critica [Bdellovibrio bacteriovorus HD100]
MEKMWEYYDLVRSNKKWGASSAPRTRVKGTTKPSLSRPK